MRGSDAGIDDVEADEPDLLVTTMHILPLPI